MKRSIERGHYPSLENWKELNKKVAGKIKKNVTLECGWGQLIFAHTFENPQNVAEALMKEKKGRRDIAFYVRDPHVVVSYAPQNFFLDPSHTYRLWFNQYKVFKKKKSQGFVIRKVSNREDAKGMNQVLQARKMMTAEEEVVLDSKLSRKVNYFVAFDTKTDKVVGTVTGVDHVTTFNDPERGSSLWSLAVDPHTGLAGVGEALVRFLIEFYMARRRAYLDLSVMHSNSEAIQLYEKLGFQRVPVFCVKRKNPINEPLFVAPLPKKNLNAYSQIIIDEARKRGVAVDVIDEKTNHFALSLGGRKINCRESLSDLTSAVTADICRDKALTHKILAENSMSVPKQRLAGTEEENYAFLKECQSVVVKPLDGEQGAGITVDVRTEEDLEKALKACRKYSQEILLEQYVSGHDVRLIIINYEYVAAAERRPAEIIGDGKNKIQTLIKKQSRRRQLATQGESKIPLDDETKRCLKMTGYDVQDILPEGKRIFVRKTANLHTGGTLHDCTEELNFNLQRAGIEIAQMLNIPVVGLDFIVPDLHGSEYYCIEANERPGLANHEPQPTAEKFIDLLFPQSISRYNKNS